MLLLLRFFLSGGQPCSVPSASGAPWPSSKRCYLLDGAPRISTYFADQSGRLQRNIAHPITVTDFLWEKHLSVTKQGLTCIRVSCFSGTDPASEHRILECGLAGGAPGHLRGPMLWPSLAVPACEGASSLIISCLCAPYSGDKQNGSSWLLLCLSPVLGATVWPSPWGRCGHVGCWHIGDQLVAWRLSM